MDGFVEELKRIRWNMRPRIVITTVFLILALIVTSIGVLTVRIDPAEAMRLKEEIEREMERANDIRTIFGNNLMHTLIMLVPVIGPMWGLFVLFNTGAFIAMFSIAEGIPPILALAVLLFTPILWLEFGVYSAAMAESVILLLQALKRQARRELVRACVIVTICTLVLLSSAAVEWIILNL